ACTGGHGDWVPGGWAPDTGCGLVDQTREATCAINANSGTRTRSITCRSSEGETVLDVYCDGLTPPAESESCTPNDTSVCGPPPPLPRPVSLRDAGGCVPDPENGQSCLRLPF